MGGNIEIISAKTDRIKDFLQRLRSGWKDTLTAHLGEYYGNTMSAVLLGEKGGLDEEMKKLYQKNGIGHILAISGLHMSFIGSAYTACSERPDCLLSSPGCAAADPDLLYTDDRRERISRTRPAHVSYKGRGRCGRKRL